MNHQENAAPPVRLNKYLAGCGLGSRRACDGIISAGRILVNGKRVTELGSRVVPGRDRVEYLGREISPVTAFKYLAYHKPQSLIVTKHDPEGRTTVFDALRESGFHADGLNYVGRLDVASEGLLLLTNDGSLIHALTHPRYHIKKVYDVLIDKKLSEAHRATMTGTGIESEGQILRAGSIRDTGFGGVFWCRVELYEGKRRQIRRMFEALGYTVARLRRIQFASVKLGDLAVGAARELTQGEVDALRSAGFPPKR
jgi:23S rRNA pseudouridine2605 synthase